MASSPIGVLGALSDELLRRQIGEPSVSQGLQWWLYAALRREQAAVVVAASTQRTESSHILSHAQGAYRELQALIADRAAGLVDRARDGEWTLRELLRHALAVELR